MSSQFPAIWVDQIASVSLGTSTGKTKLGGTQVQGTSADYTVPGDARDILAVSPKLYERTPTANQAVVATLKIESADLHLGDYEVFAAPIDSNLGTNATALQDAAPWYPLNFIAAGGEKMQFFGTPQIANTVAPQMGASLWLADTPGTHVDGVCPTMANIVDYAQPFQAKIAGINYSGGPTTAGNTGVQTFDGGLQIAAPQKLIKGVYGVWSGTTPAASKEAGGQFAMTAGELVLNPLRWQMDPVNGFLGTTTSNSSLHISKAEGLNIRLKSPSFVKGSFTIDTQTTTAGNFEVGYLYQDAPRA